MQSIRTITSELIESLILKAHESPRLRTIFCFHDGDWEHCHRMLNALAVGTYIRPHRHADRHQSEGFILLRGKLGLVIFDENGDIDQNFSQILDPENGTYGMDLPPNTWHTLVAIEDSVIYEIKGHPSGGYVGERDKSFAEWAPEEGPPDSIAYLKNLEEFCAKLSAVIQAQTSLSNTASRRESIGSGRVGTNS